MEMHSYPPISGNTDLNTISLFRNRAANTAADAAAAAADGFMLLKMDFGELSLLLEKNDRFSKNLVLFFCCIGRKKFPSLRNNG